MSPNMEDEHVHEIARRAAVHRLSAEYAAERGVENPEIASAEDLYDPASGLPV